MEITTKRHRYFTIYNWKRLGVIYPDFDQLYNRYINTMNCEHCLKEFQTTRERHLDHDHETGQFRSIVCIKCNTYDNYIKKTNETTYNEYYNNNREKILDRQKQKYTCECGGAYIHANKAKHNRTEKHLNYNNNL